MLASTVVDLHTMAARHCTPAHDRNQQRPAQPLHTDNTCSYSVAVSVGSYTTAVVYNSCHMYSQRLPPPPTTRAQHHSPTAKLW
jgi:hypothetical protein